MTANLNDDELARSCPTGHRLASPSEASLERSKCADEDLSAYSAPHSDEDMEKETRAEV